MRTLTTRLRSLVFASLLLLGLFAPSAPGQCQPDGLDGGTCCAGTGITLPTFPMMQLQSTRFMCFDSCSLATTALWCARFGAPTPMQAGGAFVCGAYDIPIKIRNCGLPIGFWKGSLRAFYSRNWLETSPSGAVYTVWRFNVNGDLKPMISLNSSQNFRPPCAVFFGNNVYFSGFIDYVLDCNSGQWQIAWNLNHECDGVHHVPGTARPAPASGFHPTRSYSFVGPGNTFAISSTNPLVSGGPITQQAVRAINWFLFPFSCNFEEQATGFFQPMSDFCMCSPTGLPQYNRSIVQATGACGSIVAPSPLSLLLQKRLGTWTNPNQYPGVETLLFDFGFLDYTDACFGAVGPQWFEGSETINGFAVTDFSGAPIATQFEDLGSANQSATSPAIHIGAPHVVYYMLNFNMP